MQTMNFCNDFSNYGIHNFKLACIVLFYTHVVIFIWNLVNTENACIQN
jgi:hypothetical protein